MKTKLPDKMSALIRVALADLAKAERSKNYKINMSAWHNPEGENKCEVCLAGSVMAFSLGVQANYWMMPSDFNRPTFRKLNAIDALREGAVSEAATQLNLDEATYEKCRALNRRIPAYRNPKFKPAMRKLVRDLEKVGL